MDKINEINEIIIKRVKYSTQQLNHWLIVEKTARIDRNPVCDVITFAQYYIVRISEDVLLYSEINNLSENDARKEIMNKIYGDDKNE